jgi:hypothetical protein
VTVPDIGRSTRSSLNSPAEGSRIGAERCEAVRVHAAVYPVGGTSRHRLLPPGSESGTRCSRIARIRSNRGGGAHDHLDAMNTGQAAVTWLSPVGMASLQGVGRR